MYFIDSHTHIDFPSFSDDLEAVLSRAQDNGVKQFIVSATTAQRWKCIRNVTLNHPACFAAYGLHPLFMQEHQPNVMALLQDWVSDNDPVAIGEIGLDFFIPNPDKKAQLSLFITQLELAVAFDLPVIIHARKSLDLVLKELRRFTSLRGSIHSFSGSEQQANQLIDRGFYLGFGGPITYNRATRLRTLVTNLPLERLLLETDSPDQPDASHHGQRNEPTFLPIIAQTIADLKDIDIKTVAHITRQNTLTLFPQLDTQT